MDVQVKYSDEPAAFAGKLLAAARELDLDPGVVRFSPEGYYTVPEEVADKAKVSYDGEASFDEQPTEIPETPQEPADGPDGESKGQESDGEPDGSESGPDAPDEGKQAEVAEAPKKNARRDDWVTYLQGVDGVDPDHLKSQDEGGLSRADLIAKYAPKE